MVVMATMRGVTDAFVAVEIWQTTGDKRGFGGSAGRKRDDRGENDDGGGNDAAEAAWTKTAFSLKEITKCQQSGTDASVHVIPPDYRRNYREMMSSSPRAQTVTLSTKRGRRRKISRNQKTWDS